MALLIAAGLFIKSLSNVSRVDLGLTTENIITFTISPRMNGYEPEDSHNLFSRLEDRVCSRILPVLAPRPQVRLRVVGGSKRDAPVSCTRSPNSD